MIQLPFSEPTKEFEVQAQVNTASSLPGRSLAGLAFLRARGVPGNWRKACGKQRFFYNVISASYMHGSGSVDGLKEAGLGDVGSMDLLTTEVGIGLPGNGKFLYTQITVTMHPKAQR
jgi:hypothetical protein